MSRVNGAPNPTASAPPTTASSIDSVTSIRTRRERRAATAAFGVREAGLVDAVAGTALRADEQHGDLPGLAPRCYLRLDRRLKLRVLEEPPC